MTARASLMPTSNASPSLASRILLVDDDQLVLRSLERMLKRWATDRNVQLRFARDSKEAQRELEQAPVDVILVDAIMPNTSGIAVLQSVQERFPSTVRILMSGDSSLGLIRSGLPYAHQFLPKPCDEKQFCGVLEGAVKLRQLMTKNELRNLVGASNELPSIPKVYFELANLLGDPKANLRNIAAVVEKDIAISARVMQLVSSAFYGVPRTVTTIAGAVAFLGIEVVRAIVLSVEVARIFPPQVGADFSAEALQAHAGKVAQLARRIIRPGLGDDVVLIAALLQDVGQLLLAARCAQRFSIALSKRQSQKIRLAQVEKELFGATHAEVGAYLLGLWGVHERVVHAIQHHLEPWNSGERVVSPAVVLYVANLLTIDPDIAAVDDPAPETPAIDLEYLRLLGIASELEPWRRMAKDIQIGRVSARAG